MIQHSFYGYKRELYETGELFEYDKIRCRINKVIEENGQVYFMYHCFDKTNVSKGVFIKDPIDLYPNQPYAYKLPILLDSIGRTNIRWLTDLKHNYFNLKLFIDEFGKQGIEYIPAPGFEREEVPF